MFCTQCGAKLPDDANFCTSCGAKANRVEVSEPIVEEVEVAEPVAQPAAVEELPVEEVPATEEIFSSAPLTEEVAEEEKEPATEEVFETPVLEVVEETVEEIVEEMVEESPIECTADDTKESEGEIPFADAAEFAKVEYVEPDTDEIPVEADVESANEILEEVDTDIAPQKKTSRVAAFFRGVLSVFMCIIIVAFATVSLVLVSVKSTLNANNISNILSDPEFTSGALGGFLGIEESNMDSFAAELEEMIQEETDIDANIDGDALEKFLTNKKFTSFVSEKASGFITDTLEGTNDTKITEREVRKWIDENRRLVEKTFDVELSDDDVKELAAWINLNDSLENVEAPDLEALIGFNPLLIQFAVSIAGMIIMVILTVAMLVLLMIVNKRSVRAACDWAAAPLLLVGTAFLIFGLAIKILPGILGGVVGDAVVVKLVIGNAIGNLIIWSLAFIGLAVALIVTAVIVNAIKKKIASKKVKV